LPACYARQITLTAAERHQLKRLAYSHTAAYQQVIRVRIVRDAAHGYSNAKIAVRQQVSVETVRCWRGRYADEGLPGLSDRRRPGRPPRFTPAQVAEVKAMACQLPAETETPLSKWSGPELAAEVVARGIAWAISPATIRRILAADALKPWRHQSWIFIRDPDFAAKATRVLDLYARVYDGVALDANEYVISSDEKTSIQARCRCHPTLAPSAARAMRVNHDESDRPRGVVTGRRRRPNTRVPGVSATKGGLEPRHHANCVLASARANGAMGRVERHPPSGSAGWSSDRG
jgi:transposase